MSFDIDTKSYPKMIFGKNNNLSTVEAATYAAELVICDIAGTTVEDDGLVLEAFRNTAIDMELRAGTVPYDDAVNYAQNTMGHSKIEVFRHIFSTDVRARQANLAFERHYAKFVSEFGVNEIPGASELFATLRARSIKIALTTGFSKTTQELILNSLGWKEKVDYFGSPGATERGRPYPDMILAAMNNLGIENPQNVIVLGDTSSDIQAAKKANVCLAVGVLSGAHGSTELLNADADLILDSVSDLVTLFYAFGKTAH